MPGALLALAQTAAPATGGEAQGDVLAGLPAGAGYGEEADKLPKITAEMVRSAAGIAGVSLTDAQIAQMLEGLGEQRSAVVTIRTLHLPNSVAPAFIFNPLLGTTHLDTAKQPTRMSDDPDMAGLAEAARAVAQGHGSQAGRRHPQSAAPRRDLRL